eukprot:gene15152-12559_t
MRVVLLTPAALPLVAGHGSVVHPPPRNAIDSNLAPWNGTVPVSPDGSACFWFSSGCSIGCPKCNGFTRGPIPNARTVNVDKEDGAADDWYQYSPWRAPGSAGVIDPCGRGDHGSALKRREAGTVWTAGKAW